MFHREILVTTSEVDGFLSDCPREEHEESLFTTSLHSETPLTQSDTQWLSRILLACCYQTTWRSMTQLLKWTQSTGRSSNDTSSFLHAMEKFSLGNYFSSPNSAHIGVYKTFFCPPSVDNIRSDESTHRSQKCIRLMQILNQLLTTMVCVPCQKRACIFSCVCVCVLIYPFLWFNNSKWMWKTYFFCF